MHRSSRLLLLLGLLLLGLTVSAVTIWLLWPVQCESTLIGFTTGQPDPNLHMCTRRIGTTISQEGARASTLFRGIAAGTTVTTVGAATIWWLHRKPRH